MSSSASCDLWLQRMFHIRGAAAEREVCSEFLECRSRGNRETAEGVRSRGQGIDRVPALMKPCAGSYLRRIKELHVRS